MKETTLNISNGNIILSTLKGEKAYKQGSDETLKPYTGALTITGYARKRINYIEVQDGKHNLILNELSLHGTFDSLRIAGKAGCTIQFKGDNVVHNLVTFKTYDLTKDEEGNSGSLQVRNANLSGNLEIVYPQKWHNNNI